MKKAKIIRKQGKHTPNGRELRMELRAGERGKGEIIQTVIAWPWSEKSMEKAHEILDAAAHRAGFKIVDGWE